ncbi:MAG: hypothetical protein QOJ07_1095 [Thermoleophilaceae bacterium]|nr:hypothetical protein [Thermoleophilaceae bacterium]
MADAPKRRVAVVTGTRADYGLLRPTLARLHEDPRFDLRLIVAAMHLDPRHGNTIGEIEFPVAAELGSGPDDFGDRMAAALAGFTTALAELRPDVLLVLGDRWEVLAAALAATGLAIPIAHLHGGELSEGSLDDAMRHSVTKLAHLHFVAAREYGERVVQLGERPDRVHLAGAAGIESIATLPLLGLEELAGRIGVPLARPLASLTFHPASLDAGGAAADAAELAAAVEDVFGAAGTVVVSLPNDDPGSADVRAELVALTARAPNVVAFESLGQLRYLSLLKNADVVVGNSSSGVLEAPWFRVPVVNVGDRQRGRIAPANVIGAPAERGAIAAALRRALDPAFRDGLADMDNPFGEGDTSRIVVEALAAAPLAALRDKRFLDLPDGPWRSGLRFATDDPAGGGS